MRNETLIKIAIADDHKISRDGIKMALAGKQDLKMLWEAEDGKDMMHKIAIKKPVEINPFIALLVAAARANMSLLIGRN